MAPAAPGEIGVAYYSAIHDLYWGVREDAVRWLTRARAERLAREAALGAATSTPPVDSEAKAATADEISRRKGYAPGS